MRWFARLPRLTFSHLPHLSNLSKTPSTEVPVWGALDLEGRFESSKTEDDSPDTKLSVAGLGVVWVPTECVRVVSLTVPGKQARLWQAALPYALEASLVQPLDEVHFVVLARQTQGPEAGLTTVMVCDRQWLQRGCQAVSQAGLDLARVALCPDFLRLPWQADTVAHTTLTPPSSGSTRHLVREGQWQGFAVDEALWPLVKPQGGFTSSALTSKPDAKSPLSSLQARHASLLQKAFAPAAAWRARVLPWRGAAVAGVILSLLWGWDYHQHTQRLLKQAHAYEQQAEADFRARFPQVQRIVNLKAQTKTRVRQMQAPTQAHKPIALAGKLQMLAQQRAETRLRLKSLRWQDQAWQLHFQAEQTQALEQLTQTINQTQWQAQPLKARLQIEQAGASGAQGTIYVATD